MIHKAKDLAPDQKMAIESLLGRSVAEDEAITIRAVGATPAWLQKSWESAQHQGLDRLSADEIDAEIVAAERHGVVARRLSGNGTGRPR